MAKRKPNLTTAKVLEAIKHVTERLHGDVCTGDIAEHLGYHPSGILTRLKGLKAIGVVVCRHVQGGRMPLWCVVDCACFGGFDCDSASCKCCSSSVACFEESCDETA